MNAEPFTRAFCRAKQEKCSIDSAAADLEPLQVKRKKWSGIS